MIKVQLFVEVYYHNTHINETTEYYKGMKEFRNVEELREYMRGLMQNKYYYRPHQYRWVEDPGSWVRVETRTQRPGLAILGLIIDGEEEE